MIVLAPAPEDLELRLRLSMLCAMIVCHCRGRTDRDVRRAVESGAVTTDEIARACGAGADCGNCRESVEQVIVSILRRSPPAPSAVETAFSTV